ncbi:hypothetical protein WJX72_009894 [[Myrmecia] bisecta]|uniref:Uncharacterized protein n=1 Tax=[Myrmecia] bisecta TaxID=41462 RepID=A0AAW1PGZ2_9CHLO
MKISNDQNVQIHDVAGDNAFSTCATAFYADCQHEIQEVTSGYCLSLVYTLVHVGQGPPPRIVDRTEASRPLQPILRAWAADANSPKKLVWMLGHRYIPGSATGLHGLERRDCAVAETLLAAGRATETEVYLANFVKWYDSKTGEDSFRVYSCNNWAALDGGAVPFGLMRVDIKTEIIQGGRNLKDVEVGSILTMMECQLQ